MTRIPGLDTIAGLVGKPPRKISIDFNTMKKQQTLLPQWNKSYIAVIPFCFICKKPLVWHRPPEPEDAILFTCPECGRVWVKGEGWGVQEQS